jgi:exodeoxyribonuclease-1
MAQSFYFYDLETSGFNPRVSAYYAICRAAYRYGFKPNWRAGQYSNKDNTRYFAGPGCNFSNRNYAAIKRLADGITEAEFTKYLTEQVCTPDTIMVGFNNVRFDDEFIRYTLWRNFMTLTNGTGRTAVAAGIC